MLRKLLSGRLVLRLLHSWNLLGASGLQNPLSNDNGASAHKSVAADFQDGIGMDLTSNYGTISIAFRNGSKLELGKIDGTDNYIDTMRRLSLDSSKHSTPPYGSIDEQLRDSDRQARRQERKEQGLPASDDVEVIADMISALKAAAEAVLNVSINASLVATPNLVALYREDVEDALEYVSLRSLDEPINLFPLFREPPGAMAYHNIGLCQQPFDPPSCLAELHKLPFWSVLTILYTRTSLCVETSAFRSAYYYHPYHTYPTSMDFSLGSDAMRDNPDEDYYWQAVKDRIIAGMAPDLPVDRDYKVFLIGESAGSPQLRTILEDVLTRFVGYVPEIYDKDPTFAAASGAAEIARRGGYRDNTSDPILRAEIPATWRLPSAEL